MSGTICIVDDEPSILDTLSSILEDEKVQGRVAKTVRSPESHQMEVPDVVLLDIWMPELDGLEVLKRVRDNFHNMGIMRSVMDREQR